MYIFNAKFSTWTLISLLYAFLAKLYIIIEVSKRSRLTIKGLRWNASFESVYFDCFLGDAAVNITRIFNAGVTSIIIQSIDYALYYNLYLQKLTTCNKKAALICEIRKSVFWLFFRGARLRVFEPQFLRRYGNRIMEIGHILICEYDLYDDPDDIDHIDNNCNDHDAHE
jgi:hypothetical protein